ncbi:hypothetical protein PCC7424_2594 [Gloeothece citriformis PCC 7424]|uniref:Uncharacterized protein n=1 Tax=Gloeothece citriformis (strain PCC 7424) TaxID=65393 RepID=B7KKN9_GLOC7|nr:hypothetical protein [Gloeothece citriformis]ACK71008.1 hypothetical protein PCC7424_2594 [Gloeothece citriformis PCC 7424]
MINKNLASLVKKHPQLKNFLEKGNFLTGYTDGGLHGQMINVFVFRCSWQHFCVQAKAIGSLPAGEVLVVTDSFDGNLTNDWKAYSLKDEKSSLMKSTSLNHQSHNRSNMTSLAVEMAHKQHRHQKISSRI